MSHIVKVSKCKWIGQHLYNVITGYSTSHHGCLPSWYLCSGVICNRSCPVFHYSLPQYLSNEMMMMMINFINVSRPHSLERLQKHALLIIQPDLSYAEALVALGITSLYERRQALSKALFDQIVRDQSHKLHELLPPHNGSTYCTRSQGYFKLPICKTTRFKNTFIMENIFNY